jgi:ribosomal protein S18 acetylase RimI-like enzyme
MNYTIRKAKLSDAPGLARLYLLFWEAHKRCDPLLKTKNKITLKSEIESAKKDIRKRNTHIFVAESGGKIIGFIEFLIKKNEGIFHVQEYGYLNSAVTDKSYRKKGVARALTQEAFNMLKKKKIKYVKTNAYEKNIPAVKAWQKLGFKRQSLNMIKKL